MSNEKKNSVLEFIEENYPTEIKTDYEKGCAYACDEIEKLLNEDDAINKILDFTKNNRPNFIYTDFEDGCAYVCDKVLEILDKEGDSI